MKPERIQDEILALPGWKTGKKERSLEAVGIFPGLSEALDFVAELQPALAVEPEQVEIRTRGGHLRLVLDEERTGQLTERHLSFAVRVSDLLTTHGAANTNERRAGNREDSAA